MTGKVGSHLFAAFGGGLAKVSGIYAIIPTEIYASVFRVPPPRSEGWNHHQPANLFLNISDCKAEVGTAFTSLLIPSWLNGSECWAGKCLTCRTLPCNPKPVTLRKRSALRLSSKAFLPGFPIQLSDHFVTASE